MSQVEASSQELHGGLPCAWQGPKHWRCHLLPSSVSVIGRKLEFELELEQGGVVWDAGDPDNDLHTVPHNLPLIHPLAGDVFLPFLLGLFVSWVSAM